MLSEEFEVMLCSLADARLRHEDNRKAGASVRELAATRMELEAARDAIYRLRRRRWPELREAQEAVSFFWCESARAPVYSHRSGHDCECGLTKEPPVRSEG